MKRTFFFFVAIVFLFASSDIQGEQTSDVPAKRPNIYWIIGEDMWPNMGCFGDPVAKTPNIDRMASVSVRYPHAYTTAPVCSVSRSAIMTGMYALSINAQNHRSNREGNSPLPNGVRLLTDRFRENGYYTGNLTEATPLIKGTGKTDWNFTYKGRPFDTQSYKDLKSHQPFFVQANFSETHRGFPKPLRHNPEDMVYPPYYPDDPVIRADWAAYMESMSVFDDKVGEVLRWLEEENILEDTIVILFGDNGVAHVRGKQWCYETGLHVPLIIRWPKNFPRPSNFNPGKEDNQLIDMIDIASTSLALAGIPVPQKMEGRVFLGDNADPQRKYSFGARDRCDETVFRIRTVRDEQYRYILNLTPGTVPFFQTNRYKIDSYPALLRLFRWHAEGKLTAVQEKIFFAPSLPAEELYDEVNDPFEMNNLMDSPDHQEVLTRLRGALNDWRVQVGDDDAHFQFEAKETVEAIRDDSSAKNDEKIRRKIKAEGLEHWTDKILNDLPSEP